MTLQFNGINVFSVVELTSGLKSFASIRMSACLSSNHKVSKILLLVQKAGSVRGLLLVMQLSHLPRFDHDWYRGLHRGPIGTIVSNLIRSHHILISIVLIGLIVEKFLAAKNFATITTIGGTIVTIASDRMTS